MNKVRLNFEKREPVSIGEFGGVEIFVNPYITYQEKLLLISRYLATYFLSDISETEPFLTEYNYLGAEQELLLGILDEHTNIQVFDNEKFVLDLDGLLSSELPDILKMRIENYKNIEETIYILVNNIKEEKFENNSFKKVLDSIVEKLIGFVEGLSNIEMTEEGLGKIADEISKIGTALKDSPVSAIIEDSKRK